MLRHDAAFSNRALLPHPAGIRFGDLTFTEPIPLDTAVYAPPSIGIYVLLALDPTWSPRHFQPVYFGEFGVVGAAQMTAEEQSRCLRVAAGRGLYVAVCSLPPHLVVQLTRIKNELIRQYTPIGNVEFAQESPDSRSPIEGLEKKATEHDVVLRLVLAAIGQTGLNQPEPKRRPIGFRPFPAESRRVVR